MGIDGLRIQSDIYVAGLVPITEQTFSTAATVSVNNCFSSTYDNYRLIVSVPTVSAADMNVTLRLRVGGVDNSTASSYVIQKLSAQSTSVAGSVTTSDQPTLMASSSTYPTATSAFMDVLGPFQATPTLFTGNYSQSLSSVALYTGTHTLRHNQSTSYDGFSLITSTGTMTGVLYVYGYN
jgi:hypothetical protein